MKLSTINTAETANNEIVQPPASNEPSNSQISAFDTMMAADNNNADTAQDVGDQVDDIMSDMQEKINAMLQQIISNIQKNAGNTMAMLLESNDGNDIFGSVQQMFDDNTAKMKDLIAQAVKTV